MSDTDNTKVLSRGEPDDYVRLSAHPRAQRAIVRSKAIGGLVGFLFGFWLGSRAGLPAWDTGVRALAGGIAGYVLIWVAAVQIWSQVAIAEYRHADKRRSEQRAVERAALAEIRRQRAERAEAARQG